MRESEREREARGQRPEARGQRPEASDREVINMKSFLRAVARR